MFNEGYVYNGSSFEQAYRCYPLSSIDKPQLESGDKILMPPSALDRLAWLYIDYPMLFELYNAFTSRTSHSGVLEFTAEEGMIYIPYWMMQNLLLQEGDIVRVRNATLPKGSYVKLQPHTKDFFDISNPKAILENSLRNFTCMTTGDTIMVAYNNKNYYIDIVETRPSNAVSIIETDCEVDFAPPLDYKEPVKQNNPVSAGKAPDQESCIAISADEAETEAADASRFAPFTGAARRLVETAPKDGPQLPAPSSNDLKSNTSSSMEQPALSTPQSSSFWRSKRGLVFGGSKSKPGSRGTEKAGPNGTQEEQSTKKGESKFQAFIGKGCTLKKG